MDRTLLLEAEGSEEEAAAGDGANQAVGDEDSADSAVSDLEVVADSPDTKADKEG